MYVFILMNQISPTHGHAQFCYILQHFCRLTTTITDEATVQN